MSNYDLSVVVRVRNERSALDRLLTCLSTQVFEGTFEVIVVDNASDDDSLRVALAHGVRVFLLPRHLFTYGRAINIGINRCRADLIVLLSAHAWPLETDWLQRMANMLRSSPNIEAAFCRQVPLRPVGNHEEMRFSGFSGPSTLMNKQVVGARLEKGFSLYQASYFSNSACIIRKAAVRLFPMRDLPYAEENAFALDCITHGRSVAYLETPAVCYSGPISLKRLYETARRQTIAEKLIEDFYGPALARKRPSAFSALRPAVNALLIPFMLVEIGYRALFDDRYRLGSRALMYDLYSIGTVWGQLVGALTWRRFGNTLAVDTEESKAADAAMREVTP
jgi:glycosyltransferase involved in cell wall biosynthesis